MTLSIQDLGAIGELLGSVAVLVTLVYLAMQTRQNTMAIGAQLDAARIDSLHQISTWMSSPELSDAILEDRKDDLSANELRRSYFFGQFFRFQQWQYQQAQRGLLPTFYEPSVASVVAMMFQTSHGLPSWWEGWKQNFHPEFVEWVEEQRDVASVPTVQVPDQGIEDVEIRSND